MKKLWIEPGCITCGMCEFIAPKVFEVTDVSHIKPDADMQENSDLIEQSVVECPVSVIKFEVEDLESDGLQK
ncbi:MAG: ferredoxin [Candidatus Chromulinivorax sp.]|nr:ferredoxin [Candidatus Chromulinivorax sp.]